MRWLGARSCGTRGLCFSSAGCLSVPSVPGQRPPACVGRGRLPFFLFRSNEQAAVSPHPELAKGGQARVSRLSAAAAAGPATLGGFSRPSRAAVLPVGPSRWFVAAAAATAAVRLAAAAANPAAVAAAARHTGALAAPGGAGLEGPGQQIGGGPGKPELEKAAAAAAAAGGEGVRQSRQAGGVISKQAKRMSLGALLLAAGAAGCTAWALAHMKEHNMSFAELATDLWRQLDAQMTLSHERIYNMVEDAISGVFPEDKEPLLPDFKDLNYPEYLPTLVLDFDGVLAKIGHDRAGGYKLRKRPHSEYMVNQLSHFFEVVVWNSDQPPVVQTALQQWALPVTACLNLDNMSKHKGRRIKDFSRLGRRADRLIYVSCTDEGLDERYRANFIRVSPFEGTAEEMTTDSDLLDLVNFLKHCSLSPDDVRQSIARFGGGEDGGVGRRFEAAKKVQESKANQRRNIGKLFGMGPPSQGGAPGLTAAPPPQQQMPSAFGLRPGF